MALNYLTLSNKPKIKIKDKEGNTNLCIDLLAKTTDSIFVQQPGSKRCIVNKYYVARPDLISLAFYGTDEYADIICKVNGISNPFELNEDDLLDIPALSTVRYYSSPNEEANELVDTNSTISKSKSSKQKKLDQKRSPNEQTIGDKNYVIDRTIGLIFY